MKKHKRTTNIDDELEYLTKIHDYRDEVIKLEASLLERKKLTDAALCQLHEYDRWFRNGSIFVLTIEQIEKAWNDSSTKHEAGKLLDENRKARDLKAMAKDIIKHNQDRANLPCKPKCVLRLRNLGTGEIIEGKQD